MDPSAPLEKNVPPPPPPTYTGEIVTMVVKPKTESAFPASHVPKYRTRHELEYRDDPSDDEEQTFYLPSFLKNAVRKLYRKTRYVGARILSHSSLAHMPETRDWTTNTMLNRGLSLDKIASRLEIENVEGFLFIGLSAPLGKKTWKQLTQDYELLYRHLEPEFNLINIVEYKNAGITPSILYQDMGVTAETFLEDRRFDRTTLTQYSLKQWKNFGFKVDMLPRLGINVAEMAAMYDTTVEDVLGSLVEDGSYLLRGPNCEHDIEIENGRGVSTEYDGHTHLVSDRTVQSNGNFSLLRYID